MNVKYFDYKQISVDTEKGPLQVFLPIGLDLQEAFDICCNLTGVVSASLQKFKEEESKEKESELAEKDCDEHSSNK